MLSPDRNTYTRTLGVWWAQGKWEAYIFCQGRHQSLGRFTTEEAAAARAYDAAAKTLLANPVLNFLPDGSLNPNRKKHVYPQSMIPRHGETGARSNGRDPAAASSSAAAPAATADASLSSVLALPSRPAPTPTATRSPATVSITRINTSPASSSSSSSSLGVTTGIKRGVEEEQADGALFMLDSDDDRTVAVPDDDSSTTTTNSSNDSGNGKRPRSAVAASAASAAVSMDTAFTPATAHSTTSTPAATAAPGPRTPAWREQANTPPLLLASTNGGIQDHDDEDRTLAVPEEREVKSEDEATVAVPLERAGKRIKVKEE